MVSGERGEQDAAFLAGGRWLGVKLKPGLDVRLSLLPWDTFVGDQSQPDAQRPVLIVCERIGGVSCHVIDA